MRPLTCGTAPGGPPDSGRTADGGGPVDLEEALCAARDGCERGFTALYRDLQPRLLRYATALVGAEAEDVTAETWLQVARDVRGFRGDLDGFRGWVSTVCRNRALDAARRRGRRPADAAEVSVLVGIAGPGDTAVAALDGLGTSWAMAKILALPRREAEAVLLRAVVGLDAPTAGQVLGIRPGTVRVAAHRGLKRLAKALEAERRGAGERHV